MKLWSKILFIGDSLTHGSRDPYGLSFPFYMAQLALEDKYLVLPEVNAVPGRTSSETVREVLPQIEKSDAKEVVILIGTNDCKDRVNLPADMYRRNVAIMVGACLAFEKHPYVITVPKPYGFGSVDYPSSIVERVASYNQALLSPAPVCGNIVDLAGVDEYGYFDGIHFSAPASKEVAKRLWLKIKNTRSFT